MKDWVETRTSSGRFDNASGYVRDLIRHDQDRASKSAAMQKFISPQGVRDNYLRKIPREPGRLRQCWDMAETRPLFTDVFG